MSKHILRNGEELPRLTDRLPTVQEAVRQMGIESQSDRIYRELDKVRKEAAAEGHAEGYTKGFHEGMRVGQIEGAAVGRKEALAHEQVLLDQKQQEIDEFAQAMRDFVGRVDGAMDDWQRAAEQKLTSLAIEIARRALRQELQVSRESVVAIAAQAIAETINSDSFRILVNPFDVSILESHRAELTAALSSIKSLEIAADEQIEGGCIIQADEGIIDARVESYIDRLDDEMRRVS